MPVGVVMLLYAVPVALFPSIPETFVEWRRRALKEDSSPEAIAREVRRHRIVAFILGLVAVADIVWWTALNH